MGNKSKNTLLITAVGVLMGGAMPPVMAQDSGARVLEEIIVTARKREESLNDVPVAISAFTASAIEESGIDELGDILNNTVGMVYNERDGNRAQAQPGVRGIKSFTGGGAARVSTFIDGMPLAGSQATVQFVDVESVEVYRGPQSAVFGRAVFAGALNYNYREPSLDEQTGAINLQVGQDGREGLNGFFSTALVEDVLGLYVSAATDSYDGPGGATSTDGYELGARDTEHYSVALKYQMTDQLSATVRYTSTELDDGPAPDYNLTPFDATLNPDGDPNYQRTATQIANNGAPLYSGELNYLEDPVFRRNFCVDEGLATQNCIQDPGWKLERERLAFDVNYDLDNGHSLTFKAFTSEDTQFNHDDQDNSDTAVVHMGTDTDIEEDYYELIWTSPSDNQLRYTLGYSNYETETVNLEYFVHPTATLGGTGGTTPSGGTTSVKNTGLFGGVFYDVSDALTLSFEGRQQSDDISTNDPDPTDAFVPEANSDTFLPRVAATFAVSDEVNLYAQYSQGVQPATVNSGAVATQQRAIAVALGEIGYEDATPFLDGLVAVEEEVLDSYEIGMKGTFLDGRLGLNAAIFVIETEGYVETQNMFFYPAGADPTTVLAELGAYGTANGIDLLLPAALGTTSVRVRGGVNTADIASKGLELEGTYLLGDNWELSGQLTYLKAEFDNGCVPVGESFGIEDNTLVLPGGVGVPCTTVDGNAFPFTPEVQLGLAATYSNQLSNGMDWFTRVDMRYEDEQYMDWFEAGFLPASTKFNLRAGISTDRFRIEAYIENLTDDDTPLGAQYEPGRPEVTAATGLRGGSAVGLNVAAAYPREIGLKIGYSF